MARLAGKVAVITGGSSGIGAASARLFYKEGARVAVFARGEAELQRVVADFGENGLAIAGDVSRMADLDRLFNAVHDRFGRIDVLFANAGMNNPVDTVVDMSEEGYDRTFAVNAKGVYFTVQKAVPHLKDPASIILTSSVGHTKGWPGNTVYAATKAAIRAFARGMSGELVDRGVRVNVLSPGPTETDVFSPDDIPQEKLGEMKQGVIASLPVGRIAEPDEIARAALFLASDDSSFMLGSELAVDGGLTQL
ncbi:glucose 1-dehydrogenase [Pararhizobium mangrovi]|uniref:Glucose 1-dehydrogenase n=1 Tax=Pararhizobium mangrovi TaxID=2590452 RepID=A0A506U301_9HYPH|nr:glucose 1-dehydrogenase [Pararhizobium mangrovi]TPW27736.1 glucose 1-dehydrogenase [Pararhizobium mangrovi]